MIQYACGILISATVASCISILLFERLCMSTYTLQFIDCEENTEKNFIKTINVNIRKDSASIKLHKNTIDIITHEKDNFMLSKILQDFLNKRNIALTWFNASVKQSGAHEATNHTDKHKQKESESSLLDTLIRDDEYEQKLETVHLRFGRYTTLGDLGAKNAAHNKKPVVKVLPPRKFTLGREMTVFRFIAFSLYKRFSRK